MSYRMLSIFLVIFGSVLVIALIILGRDLHRAARTGPTWKRKLVAAGLVLLGAFGIGSGCVDRAGSGDGSGFASVNFDDPIPPGQSLVETYHWRHLQSVWREAHEIGSGARGAYPFDREGKQRVLDDITTVASNLEKLEDAELLTAAEAGLLAEELGLLKNRVLAKRPTEMQNATCYMTAMVLPGRESLDRLNARLPLLEELADSDTVQLQVVSKVLGTVDKDLDTLADEETLDQLPDDEKAEAEAVVREARELVERIRDTLTGSTGALENQRQWKFVVNAWQAVTPVAMSGKSRTAERKAIDARLDQAKQGIRELTAAGLLSEAEAQLLVSEAKRLRSQMYRNPPTDMDPSISCYDMALIVPAQQSLERLNQRLPLLQELAADGKVQPAALRKVIGSVEADIQLLSNEEELKQLAPEQRQRADELREGTESAVAEIKRLLEESE